LTPGHYFFSPPPSTLFSNHHFSSSPLLSGDLAVSHPESNFYGFLRIFTDLPVSHPESNFYGSPRPVLKLSFLPSQNRCNNWSVSQNKVSARVKVLFPGKFAAASGPFLKIKFTSGHEILFTSNILSVRG
jgi:hypothetical protein